MCVSTLSVLYVLEETGQLITELVADLATFLQLMLWVHSFPPSTLGKAAAEARGAGKCRGLAAQPKAGRSAGMWSLVLRGNSLRAEVARGVPLGPVADVPLPV